MWVEYYIQSREEIVFYNLTGKSLFSYELDPSEHYLLIKDKNLESGIYIYRVFSEDQIISTDKITVIK